MDRAQRVKWLGGINRARQWQRRSFASAFLGFGFIASDQYARADQTRGRSG